MEATDNYSVLLIAGSSEGMQIRPYLELATGMVVSYIPLSTYRLHINGALSAQRPALAGLMAVSPRPHHLSIEAQGEHVVPYAPAGGDDAVAGRLRVEEGGVGPADTEVRRPLGLGGELDNLHLKVPAVVHGAALTYANIDVRMEAGGGGGGFTEAAYLRYSTSLILPEEVWE